MDPAAATILCPQCQTQIAPGLLNCPSCRRLVHTQRLNEIAAEAQRAQETGDLSAAAALWRQGLELLPQQSQQYRVISQKITDLSAQIDAAPSGIAAPSTGTQQLRGALGKSAIGMGVLALFLWKFKFILVFILTKGKLLLLGLTNASTALSMLLSLGVYWTAWGWKFAAGLIASIYVHEMGHVAVMCKFGFRATAPMFVPGLGAVIRLKQHPVNAQEDARIGLAGPIWGLGAALISAAIWLITGHLLWGAIARVGAWINLFNLLPLRPLDGGRGFRALSRAQAWWITVIMAAMWFTTHESLLVLLLIVAVFNSFSKAAAAPGDRTAFVHFAGLLIALSLMTRLPIQPSMAIDQTQPTTRLSAAQPPPEPHAQSQHN